MKKEYKAYPSSINSEFVRFGSRGYGEGAYLSIEKKEAKQHVEALIDALVKWKINNFEVQP